MGKSTNSQLWPILGKICMDGAQPFDIVFYLGIAKSDDANTYLTHFCEEILDLINNGFDFNGCQIKIKIDSFCCDATTYSFLKKKC